jgi:Cache domain
MIHQSKTESVLTILFIFFLFSFFSLMCFQHFSINYAYAATTSLDQPVQNSQEVVVRHNTLLVNILANNLGNRLNQLGSILKITANLPQIRNVSSSAHLLNQTLNTLHGTLQQADIEKIQIARNIIASNSSLYEIFLLKPNGDEYLYEPYSTPPQGSTPPNFAFRDYFQGAIRTNDAYLGNVITSYGSGIREALIAVPVHSLKDNSTIAGVWAGGIDFNVLNKELQSLNITSLDDSTRVVYVDSKGQKVADSDVNKSATHESFANLKSFKNAVNGRSGSIIDTLGKTNMLMTYKPVKAFQNTFVVLLMHANNSNIN